MHRVSFQYYAQSRSGANRERKKGWKRGREEMESKGQEKCHAFELFMQAGEWINWLFQRWGHDVMLPIAIILSVCCLVPGWYHPPGTYFLLVRLFVPQSTTQLVTNHRVLLLCEVSTTHRTEKEGRNLDFFIIIIFFFEYPHLNCATIVTDISCSLCTCRTFSVRGREQKWRHFECDSRDYVYVCLCFLPRFGLKDKKKNSERDRERKRKVVKTRE